MVVVVVVVVFIVVMSMNIIIIIIIITTTIATNTYQYYLHVRRLMLRVVVFLHLLPQYVSGQVYLERACSGGGNGVVRGNGVVIGVSIWYHIYIMIRYDMI